MMMQGCALEILQVGSPEEAWALKADVLAIRVMNSRVADERLKQIELDETKVLKTEVKEADGDYTVVVHALCVREGKRWQVATSFHLVNEEGQFYVSSMEVDRLEFATVYIYMKL